MVPDTGQWHSDLIFAAARNDLPNIMVHQGNTPFHPNLQQIGLRKARNVWWNLPPARLIERTLLAGEGKLTSTGAIAIETGRFTGRSPLDRFIVKDTATRDEVWWGDINQAIEPEKAMLLHAEMMEYIEGKGLYVRDAFVGAAPEFRKGVRVMTEKAWSNLFAYNMFIRPTAQEMGSFEPVVYNLVNRFAKQSC